MYSIALILPLLSLIMTGIVWNTVQKYLENRTAATFYGQIESFNLTLEQRVETYRNLLLGGVGLFIASDEVERNEWYDFANSLATNELYPGIQGYGYAAYVPKEQLQQFEAKIAEEGFPDFKVTPVGDRNEYTSIIYLEPFDARNRKAFGYDMYSEKTRRTAMAQARDTGLAVMSGKVTLVQEGDTDIQAGFLIYLPVFDKEMPTETPEQRRAALKGYVYAPFRAKDFMRGIFNTEQTGLHVEIYDGQTSGEVSENTQLFTSNVEESPTIGEAYGLNETQNLFLLGHPWIINYSSSINFRQIKCYHWG